MRNVAAPVGHWYQDGDEMLVRAMKTIPFGQDGFAALWRFAVVGISQNGVFYALTLLALWAGLMAWQATIVLYPLSLLVSFLANRRWSFSARARSRGQFMRFVAAYGLAYPFSIAMNWVQEVHGVASWLASLITMGCAAIALFLALNFWVFREGRA